MLTTIKGKGGHTAITISAGIAGVALLLYKTLKAAPVQRFKMAKGVPFLGILLEMEGGKKYLQTFERLADEIGDEGVFEATLLGERQVVVCTCEEVKKVMELRPSKLRRDVHLDNIKDIFNRVFNAEGADWKRHRRLTAPGSILRRCGTMCHPLLMWLVSWVNV